MDRLGEVDQQTLSWWLAERQLPNGGLNGRPEKLEDVCFTIPFHPRRLTELDCTGLLQFLGPFITIDSKQINLDRLG